MAKTREYMDYLDEKIGIAPANSQEELQAAETIAEVMRDHGLETSIQEFESHALGVLARPLLTIVLIAGLVASGLTEGAVQAAALLVSLVAAALMLLTHYGRNVFEGFGPGSTSQNVVALHRAAGDKVVKGARPIVIVAHYDTPRTSILRSGLLARYQALLKRSAHVCVIVATVGLVFQALAFLPTPVRMFLWVVGLIACLPLLVLAVAAFQERFSGCTDGSNDNKSGVAAMLSVLNKVAPADDRVAAEAQGRVATPRESDAAMMPVQARPQHVEVVEDVYGERHGEEVLRSLGILPPSCEIVYEEPKVRLVEETPNQEAPMHVETLAAPQPVRPVDVPTMEAPDADQDEAEYDEPWGQEPEEAEEGSDSEGEARAEEDDQRLDEPSETTDEEDSEREFQDEDDDDDAEYDEDDSSEEELDDEEIDEEGWDEDDYDDDEDWDDEDEPRAGIAGWFSEKIAVIKEFFATRRDSKDDYEEDDAESDEEPLEDEEYTDEELAEDEESEDEHDLDEYDDEEDSEELEESDEYVEYDEEDDGYEDTDDETYYDAYPAESEEEPDEGASSYTDEEWLDEDLEELYASDEVIYDAEESDEEDEYAAEYQDDASYIEDVEYANEDMLDEEYEYDDFEEDYEDELDAGMVSTPQPADAPVRPSRSSSLARLRMVLPELDEPMEEEADAQAWPEGDDAEPANEPSAVEEVELQLVEPEVQTWDENADGADEGYEGSYDEYEEEYEEVELTEEELRRYEELEDAEEGEPEEEYASDFEYDEDELFDEELYETPEPAVGDGEGSYETEQEPATAPSLKRRFLGLFGKGRKDDQQMQDEAPSDVAEPYEEDDYDGEDEWISYAGPNVTGKRRVEPRHAIEEYAEDADVATDELIGGYTDEYADEDMLDESVADQDVAYGEPEDGARQSAITDLPEPLPDPNTLHFDREEDDDILPRDTTGLDTISDSYDLYDDRVDRELERPRPAAIEDPDWGTSSYQPARPAMNIARRAALFDLPDPSGATVDPLEDEYEYEDEESDQEAPEFVDGLWAEDEVEEDIEEAPANRGQSSDWKGGAAMRDDLRDGDGPIVIDEDDLQDAILEMGDEFLLGHDIWFVATGASKVGHAGIKAFLDEYRREIRGAFMINLECVGAGALSVFVREGLDSSRRADRRLVRMLGDISKDLHVNLDTASYDSDETDAASAMRARVRAVSLVGIDDNDLPALSQTFDDEPRNVDPGQVSSVVRMVTELIRRS